VLTVIVVTLVKKKKLENKDTKIIGGVDETEFINSRSVRALAFFEGHTF
jgi:hypothetical protein